MKKLAIILSLVLMATALGCLNQQTQTTQTEEQKLIIYSYDSFEYLASEVIPKFEEKYGVKVELQLIGDAGEVLNRLILEKDNPRAD
ncbi:MAG: thiamine ABC transporter substrate-binding protein, partial [Thermococcus sp.]|nr:thiamine ABC transporter substrate-binding protein [Thermococcus sp.]